MIAPDVRSHEWPALVDLLDQALELPECDRRHWIESLPPQYDALRHRLHRLLSDPDMVEGSEFLQTIPKIDALPPGGDGLAPAAVAHYRIERKLSEGGMGTVWLAYRTDVMVTWQAQIARTEKARALEVRDFLIGLFQDASPYGAGAWGASPPCRSPTPPWPELSHQRRLRRRDILGEHRQHTHGMDANSQLISSSSFDPSSCRSGRSTVMREGPSSSSSGSRYVLDGTTAFGAFC